MNALEKVSARISRLEAELATARSLRVDLLVEGSAGGASLRELAAASQLSPEGVRLLLAARSADGGTLTVRQASKRAGLSTAELLKRATAGEIEPILVDGVTRFRTTDVERLSMS